MIVLGFLLLLELPLASNREDIVFDSNIDHFRINAGEIEIHNEIFIGFVNVGGGRLMVELMRWRGTCEPATGNGNAASASAPNSRRENKWDAASGTIEDSLHEFTNATTSATKERTRQEAFV